MHDLGHPLYLPLKTLHILGVVVFFGGLVTSLYWKMHADRSGDPGFASKVHARLRRMDGQLIGPGALLTFAAGYSMVRFLGGRIAQHGFVLWGLIGLFLALALWYFGMRNLNDKLAEEAEASFVNKEKLSTEYGKKSAAWVALALGAIVLVTLVVIGMVFKLPSA